MSGYANNSSDIMNVNQYFIRNSLWPAILYTAVLMIVGTAGNLLVLFVYRNHFQRSVTRMFIYALAILDLGNCIITMPAELTVLIQFTSFPSPIWCKTTRYLTYIFNGTSSFVLIAIALDRYFKVCWPMKTLITIRRAKIICISSFFLTTILAIPALLIYGELKLPIRVSDGRASILPLSESDTKSPSSQRLFVSSTSRHVPRNGNPQPTSQVDSMDIRSSHREGFSTDVTYGRFCLLNSENVDRSTPLIFYSTMFVLYIVMIILVVFFYGNVARAMFALTSRHTKMFSFSIRRACTPNTNSLMPEGNLEPCPGFSYKVNEVVSEADNRTKEHSGTSSCHNNTIEEGDREHQSTRLSGHSVKDSNKRHTTEYLQQSNTLETGYETEESSSNNDTQTRVIIQDKDNLSKKEILTTINNEGRSGFETCDNVTHLQNPEELNNPTHPTENCSPSPGSYTPPQKDGSINEQNRRSTNKKPSKQKKSKIPKIKVQTPTSKDDAANNSSHDMQPNACDITLHPLSTNPLFTRRIENAENVSHLFHLQALQVPEGRLRGPTFHDADHSRAVHKLSSYTDSNSGVKTDSMDYLIDSTNPSSAQDKTCTLTKMSSSGKKRRCVLPLRGLTTKTASQVRAFQTTSGQNVLSLSDKCLDSSQATDHLAMSNKQTGSALSDKYLLTGCRNDISQTQSEGSLSLTRRSDILQSDLRFELGNDLSKTKCLTNRSSPGDLNCPDLDSVVTLRTRTPDNAKSLPHHEDGNKTGSCQIQIIVPRKAIISAADILQEQHKSYSLHPFRTSRMLFVISLMFVISFLPFFIIALTRSSIGSLFMSMGERDLAVVSVFIRSSLISNAVNPIAYGFLSTHFRRECAAIFGRICRH